MDYFNTQLHHCATHAFAKSLKIQLQKVPFAVDGTKDRLLGGRGGGGLRQLHMKTNKIQLFAFQSQETRFKLMFEKLKV